MERRTFLKLVGATPIGAALLARSTERPRDEWVQVYNKHAYRNTRTGEERPAQYFTP